MEVQILKIWSNSRLRWLQIRTGPIIPNHLLKNFFPRGALRRCAPLSRVGLTSRHGDHAMVMMRLWAACRNTSVIRGEQRSKGEGT
jgi:hypothetical protein